MSGYDLTLNYSLKKPWPNADDNVWGQHLNENADAIDLLIKANTSSITGYGAWVDLAANPLGLWNQAAAVTRNTMFGIGSGVRLDNTNLGWNTLYGYFAGNMMQGRAAGSPISGENTFVGTLSGANQPSGSFNTYVGNVTGWGINYDCSNNTYVGMDVFRGSPELTVVANATVLSGGSGGTPGAVTVTGTSGTGNRWQGTATIDAGGVLTGPVTISSPGGYATAPASVDPVTGGGLTGATCSLTTSVGLWNAGTNNTGLGAAVMRNGSFNTSVAIGTNAMHYFNTLAATGKQVTVANAVAIGMGAMAGDNTCNGTIQNVVVVGYAAGEQLGEGGSFATIAPLTQGHTFIGTTTGRYVRSGQHDTFIGYASGSSPNAANVSFATLVGSNTGLALTTAMQLTAVGYNAAAAVTSGNSNSFFGYQAGTKVSTGSFNLIVGASAGGAVATGTTNTILGPLCGSTNLTTGTNNILIGYGIDVVTTSQSSTINIGNTFLATVAGGPASSAAHITFAGADVAFSNSLMSATALGVSLDVPNQLVTAAVVNTGGTGYLANDTLNDANGGRYSVTSVSAGAVTGISILKAGIVSGAPPSNPVTLTPGSKTSASNQLGAGCKVDLTWSGTANKALQLNKSANDVLVSSSTLSNAAVVGFLGLPASAGTPTGTPTNAASAPMLEYNKATNTLNVYNGAAWFHVTLTAGAA